MLSNDNATLLKRRFLKFLRENNIEHLFLFGLVHYNSAVLHFKNDNVVVSFPSLRSNFTYNLFYDSPLQLIEKIDKYVKAENEIICRNRLKRYNEILNQNKL